SILYTCTLAISAHAQPGRIYALPCSNVGASSPEGDAIDFGCQDGEIEVPTGGALRVGQVRGAPGATVAVDVALDVPNGVEISGVQNDLGYDPSRIAVSARSDGKPDCAVNPALGKEGTAFAFQPSGCAPPFGCTGVRALVLSFSNTDPIPSGSRLYT